MNPRLFLVLRCGSGCQNLRLRRPRELGDRAFLEGTFLPERKRCTHSPAASKGDIGLYSIEESLPACIDDRAYQYHKPMDSASSTLPLLLYFLIFSRRGEPLPGFPFWFFVAGPVVKLRLRRPRELGDRALRQAA